MWGTQRICVESVTAEEAMKILDKKDWNNLPTLDAIHQDFKGLEDAMDYISFLMQYPAWNYIDRWGRKFAQQPWYMANQ